LFFPAGGVRGCVVRVRVVCVGAWLVCVLCTNTTHRFFADRVFCLLAENIADRVFGHLLVYYFITPTERAKNKFQNSTGTTTLSMWSRLLSTGTVLLL
jgi:hypothetical protein